MTSARLPARLAPAFLFLLGIQIPRQGDPGARLELASLVRELDAELEGLRDSGLDPGAARALHEEFYREQMPGFAERFALLARASRGTEVAYDAWWSVLQYASRGPAAQATRAVAEEGLRALLQDHMDSPDLGRLAGYLRGGFAGLEESRRVDALERIGQASPVREVQAEARLALAAVLGRGRALSDARHERACALAREVLLEYGTSHAKPALKLLFVLENLAVGARCPDFEATDAEGVRFQLSEYRGRIVLLDFWGFW